MKNKNLVILAAIVVVIGAYIFFIERHRPTSEEAQANAEKIFPSIDRDSLVSMTIEGENGRVSLEKSAGQWRLREPIEFPAEESAINTALGSVLGLKADRRLDSSEVDEASYGLDQPSVILTLGTDDGEKYVLKVGNELPLGAKRALQIGESEEIALVAGYFMRDIDQEVNNWRSHDVVDVSTEQIAAIDIESGPDHIRAVQIDDTWKLLRPLEDLADDDHIRNLISDLNSLRVEEFLDSGVDVAALGLDAPEYEVTVIRGDGNDPVQLDFGAVRDGEGGTEVACRRDLTEYFWVGDKVRTRLSKAPVLWRLKTVSPFNTWDVEGLTLSVGDKSVGLIKDSGLWRFEEDGSEAATTAIQDRLSRLANLEATDFDLLAPVTPEMGRVQVRMSQSGESEEAEVLGFVFHRPFSKGGRAVVVASGRDTVMGVQTVDADFILGDFDLLRPQPESEPLELED